MTVEDVERLALQLESQPLCNVEILDQADILRQIERSCDRLRDAGNVAEGEWGERAWG